MNIEKCFLLGQAISIANDEIPDLAIIDRPPGTTDIFVGMGIVALVMNEIPPPYTLKELRLRLHSRPISEQHKKSAREAITYLLADEVLEIDSDRVVSFNHPETPEYKELLDSPD